MPISKRVDLLKFHLPVLSPGSNPLTIGFVSDTHVGPTTAQGTLERAFSILKDESPDVLILGGDYIFLEATQQRADELARLIDQVPSRVKLAVLGNHDLWAHHSLIENALRDVGVQFLINTSIVLPQNEHISVIGLDDPWTGTIAVPGDATKQNGETRIVVCHSPDGLLHLEDYEFDVFLCGHTHGGHLALPGQVPILVPCWTGYKWPHGLHRHNGHTLFVSRGLGNVEPPFRTFAPPDIALFTLTE